MKYKILLVDDENIIRVAMRNMVAYEELGFEIVGVGMDGNDALEKVKQLTPDLIITDLVMPNKDGLALIKELKEQDFQGEIVILSNYDDFSMVKEGLLMGAIEYLLKLTITGEEFEKLLKNIKEILDRKTEKRKEDTILKEEMQTFRQSKGVENWRKIVYGEKNLPNKLLRQRVEEKRKTANFYVCIKNNQEAVKKASINDWEMLAYAMQNIMREVMETEESIYLGEGSFAAILSYDTQQNRKIDEISRKMKLLIQKYMNVEVCVMYKSPIIYFEDIVTGYQQYCRARNFLFYDNSLEIINLGQIQINEKSKEDKEAAAAEIFQQVRSCFEIDEEAIVSALSQLFLTHKKNKTGKTELMKLYFEIGEKLQIEFSIKSNAKNFGTIQIEESKAETFDEFTEQITTYFINLQKEYIKYYYQKYNKEVRRIIQYIVQNKSQKITIPMLASYISLNESYMCTLFKNHTGKSIINYMNEVKMEEAKKLLEETDMLIKNVSLSVGITDPFYFNRLYKKYYGCSPTGARETREAREKQK